MSEVTKTENRPQEKWFFTFGFGHMIMENGYGINAANCFVEIHAEDFNDARNKMFENFGEKWAFQYSESEFKGIPEQYNLIRYKIIQ